jgi:tripartite-type tricarboxylate transporter receptor subunit TctC
MAESGIPNYDLYPWFAVYVPARTPEPIAAQLRDAARKALEAPALQDWLSKGGFDKFVVCGDDLSKLQASEMQRWGGVIKKANIEPQ